MISNLRARYLPLNEMNLQSSNKQLAIYLRNVGFILNVVLPSIVLFIEVVLWLVYLDLNPNWKLLLFLLSLCVGILPTAIYWGIIFNNFVPKTIAECLQLFIPFGLLLTNALINGRLYSIYENFLIGSSATYIALNLCFLVGLIYLFWKKTKSLSLGIYQVIIRILFVIILITILVAVAIIILYRTLLLLDELWPVGLLLYLTQIGSAILLFYPRLVTLYHENKL